jgi:DNA end-binding protein Ku
MAARAIWKAEVHLDSIKVPVKLYSAVEDRSVHFRLLHATDLAPVEQTMVDPSSGDPVESEEVRRGVEVDKGVFVVVSEEERDALEPPASRVIAIEQTLERASVDLRWFDRPYLLGPDGDEESYFALAEALEAGGHVGIARWVMRKKHYGGGLMARDGYLILETMRRAGEVTALPEVKAGGRPTDRRELELAEKLVSALAGPFEPSDYRDEHREKLLELLEAKRSGKVVALRPPERRESSGSLADQLEASLKPRRRKASGGR